VLSTQPSSGSEDTAFRRGALGRHFHVFLPFAARFRWGHLSHSVDFGDVRRGYALVELAIVLAVIGLVTMIALPGWGRLYDRFAVEQAASELTTALAVARNLAVLRATSARLSITADSLVIAEWADGIWRPVWRTSGPQGHSVLLEVSNQTVTFGAMGIGVGASNTLVMLRRGGQTAKVTTSRIGRVKRW
jgi:prepilin-type N-terminal cleavage/methylation domain-containing protein